MEFIVKMRDECGSDESTTVEAATRDEAWALAETATEEWCRGGDWGSDGASVQCYYGMDGAYTEDDLAEIDTAIDSLTNIVPDGYDGLSIADVESGEISMDALPPVLIAAARAMSVARAAIVASIAEADEERGVTVEIELDHGSAIAEACGYDWDEGGKTIRGCGADHADHDWSSEGEGGCTENPGVWSTGGTSMSFASHCRKCGLHRTEHTTGSQRNPGEHDTVKYTMPETWCEECQSEECECSVAEDA